MYSWLKNTVVAQPFAIFSDQRSSAFLERQLSPARVIFAALRSLREEKTNRIISLAACGTGMATFPTADAFVLVSSRVYSSRIVAAKRMAFSLQWTTSITNIIRAPAEICGNRPPAVNNLWQSGPPRSEATSTSSRAA